MVERNSQLNRVSTRLIASVTGGSDLILTQDLCHVCAVASDEVSAACEALPKKPQIISLVASSLTEVLSDVERVGAATGRENESLQLVQSVKRRMNDVTRKLAGTKSRPRVACLEWLDPIYSAEHWVPEMVAIAGGTDVLAQPGERSSRVDWKRVVEAAPEVMIVMPCGLDSQRASKESAWLEQQIGWESVPAVKTNRVFAVDGHSYFNRPGPRLFDGIEILAHLIHPDIFPLPPLPDAVIRVR